MQAATIEAGGRVLVRQSIAGALEPAIGNAGLSAAVLAAWVDRLKVPLADLKAAHAKSTLPLLRIAEATDDLAVAASAMARLIADSDNAAPARSIFFFGTGGSSLGGQTLAQLNGWNIPGAADEGQKRRPRTRFYDNLDAETLSGALGRADLASTRFVLISKSGGTPETLAQAIAAIGAVRAAGLEARIGDMFLGLTEPPAAGKSNGLRALCEHFKIHVLDHHPGIGGRFSCLTNVGLLPAIARGLDAAAVRRGAQSVIDAMLAAPSPAAFAPAVGAALAVGLERERGIRVNVMMPYADRLARFAHWYVQLWAESLGKDDEGTTPVACLGPLDQHSQLQLFMDGQAHHYLTVVRAPSAGTGIKLDSDLARLAGVGFLGGRPLGDLVAAQSSAVPEALARARRPVRMIDVDRIDEASLGALMMHMMLETILAARLLGVDAFDQPAVELAKGLTRQHLGG